MNPRLGTIEAVVGSLPGVELKGQAPPEGSPGKGPLTGLKEVTDLSACLLPLLKALEWHGDPRHVAEALPHFTDSLDITGLRNTMANLHFKSRTGRLRLNRIDSRLLPCLFLPDGRTAMVVLGVNGKTCRVFDGETATYGEPPSPRWKGTAYFFSKQDEDELVPQKGKGGWFRAVTERFRGMIYQILAISFLLNILAVAIPLFVMAVYDKVVATGSYSTLAYFSAGVGIALVCDVLLRTIRSRVIVFIGARLDNILGNAVFQRILFLPPALTERATIGAQVARIKDFETVRDFFTGPLALVFFEMPFVIIFLVIIGVLAGPVAFVPLIMIALFVLLGWVMEPFVRNGISKAARASSRRQEFTVEALSGMRAIKYNGAESKWMERYRELSSKAAMAGFYTSQVSSLINTLSHVLMISAGVATIVFGVIRVFNGDMTIGGLVASMILVWRVLAPLQTGFLAMARLNMVRSSIDQINNLMTMQVERDPNAMLTPAKKITGRVTFSRVSLRYSSDADPALVGISFEANAGDVVVVIGGNSSGKSTIVKLIAGMFHPQAGAVRIDNMDIRQMDPIELRHAVAYSPQICQFFYGTIAQNLRLANPTASDEDLRWAAEQASVLDDILAMEQGSGKWRRTGFGVRIGDADSCQLPTSFQQRLNLARCFLKRAPIMLFDEPGVGLDYESDQAFMATVGKMRGKSTMFIVTHRPSHLRLADKIVWLDSGHLRAAGPAEEVRGLIPKGFL